MISYHYLLRQHNYSCSLVLSFYFLKLKLQENLVVYLLKIFHYNIIGIESGTVLGYHIYTDDSNIAKAAVIEGLCKIGEKA